jgi:hypothetical protein
VDADGATVEAGAGVTGPHRAGAGVEPGGSRPQRLGLDRHHLRRRTGHPGVVAQAVDAGLVLEGRPRRRPGAPRRPAGHGPSRVERGEEEQRLAVGIEPVERIPHLGRRVGVEPLPGPDLLDHVRRGDVDDHDLGVLLGRGRAGAGAADHEAAPAPEVAQGPHLAGVALDDAAGQDHPPAGEQRSQQLAVALGVHGRRSRSRRPTGQRVPASPNRP